MPSCASVHSSVVHLAQKHALTQTFSSFSRFPLTRDELNRLRPWFFLLLFLPTRSSSLLLFLQDEFNFTIKVYGHIQLNLTQLPPLLPPSTQSVYFKGSSLDVPFRFALSSSLFQLRLCIGLSVSSSRRFSRDCLSWSRGFDTPHFL